MAKRKDPQAQLAYEWERSFADWNFASQSLPCLRAVINAASDMYQVSPPSKVGRQRKDKNYSSYKTKNETIRLLKNHHNVATALHEVSHHIAYKLYGKGIQMHGREWLGIYADLLVTFKIAPTEAIYSSLRARKLKFMKVRTVNRKGRKP